MRCFNHRLADAEEDCCGSKRCVSMLIQGLQSVLLQQLLSSEFCNSDACGAGMAVTTSQRVVRTLKGSEMPSWQRYFMSSNSPSGGTKLTTFSASKRPRFTH